MGQNSHPLSVADGIGKWPRQPSDGQTATEPQKRIGLLWTFRGVVVSVFFIFFSPLFTGSLPALLRVNVVLVHLHIYCLTSLFYFCTGIPSACKFSYRDDHECHRKFQSTSCEQSQVMQSDHCPAICSADIEEIPTQASGNRFI